MKLEGKNAVITGGAMGNGLGVAEVFLKYGASIVILDYSDKLEETILNLKSKYPNSNILGYKVDIRDNLKVKKCIDDTISKLNKIDILVNNAGVCKLETFEKMTDEVRDFHFDINIKGTWNVTKAVLPFMKNGSSIVNLSSVTGVMVADSGEVAYATTKAALVGFTKSLAIELASRNIRVNSILPGYIKTPMVEGMSEESNPDDPMKVINDISRCIPMKRMGTILELGELAAFLASSESSYITGGEFVIDGGSTLPETNSMGV